MNGFNAIISLVIKYHPKHSIIDTYGTLIMANLLKQSVEKIDRTRDAAGNVLITLLQNDEFVCSDISILRERLGL